MKLFAYISKEKFNELAQVKIDRSFIDKDAMGKVAEILELEGMDEEDLRAVRNTIVKTYSDLFDQVRDFADFETGEWFLTRISATTAVIDHKLYEMGAEV